MQKIVAPKSKMVNDAWRGKKTPAKNEIHARKKKSSTTLLHSPEGRGLAAHSAGNFPPNFEEIME